MKFPKIVLPVSLTPHHQQCGQAMLNLHFALHHPQRAEALIRPDSAQLLAWACQLDDAAQFYGYVGHLLRTQGYERTSRWIASVYRPFTHRPQKPPGDISDPALDKSLFVDQNFSEQEAIVIDPRDVSSDSQISACDSIVSAPTNHPDIFPQFRRNTFQSPGDTIASAKAIPPGGTPTGETVPGPHPGFPLPRSALSDRMDLFDSETWLTESPIARKMWDDSN